MHGHIIFAGVHINYIIEQVDVKKTKNYRNSPMVGQDGSDVDFINSDAKVLSFKSICLRDEMSTDGTEPRIVEYVRLSETYDKTPGALTLELTPVWSKVNGNYLITGFDYTEDTNHNFEITWELTEYIEFNVTKKTFKVWNKADAKKNAASKMNKSSGLSSSDKKLLKDCPLLPSSGSSITGAIQSGACIIALQQFLQQQGYYTKHKVTGSWNKNVTEAVKSLQKKHGLHVTGKWDESTRTYFQIKYGYPKSTTSTKESAISKAVKTKKKKK